MRTPKQIRLARRMKEIKQRDVAAKAGVTQPQYSNYERGVSPLRGERLRRVEQALGLPPSDDDGEE